MPERDPKTGRFLTGNNGGGRPKGAPGGMGVPSIGTIWSSDFLGKISLSGKGIVSVLVRPKTLSSICVHSRYLG